MERNKVNESTAKWNCEVLLQTRENNTEKCSHSFLSYTYFLILSPLHLLHLVWRGFPYLARGKKRDYYVVVQKIVLKVFRKPRDSYHTWKNTSKKAFIFTFHVLFHLWRFQHKHITSSYHRRYFPPLLLLLLCMSLILKSI